MKTAVWIYALLLATRLLLASATLEAQTGTASPSSDGAKSKRSAVKDQPSPQEIADAKAKGLVWVNTATHVYHTDGPAYGTTKHGKFLTEEDAKKAGYRIASETGNRKGQKR